MKPYSIDFRKKIIEVREQEGTSIRELAQRFRVAKSSRVTAKKEILN